MYLMLSVLLIVVVIGILTFLGFKFGIDFWVGRSNHWGSSHMEDMGMEPENVRRMRAQVMCSGTAEFAQKKYLYRGAKDCAAAERLGGGNKLCPNGCIGLGTCASVCPVGAPAEE